MVSDGIGVALSHPLHLETKRPVRKDWRDGTHSGALQYAASKVAPVSASLSMFGVRTSGCPHALLYIGPCSSDIMRSMLGC